MDKLNLTTPNLTQQNLDSLAALFPTCITESADKNGNIKKSVNFSVLKQLLGGNVTDDAHEHYEFTWVGKRQAMAEAAKPTTETLRPDMESSRDWNTTQNLYIEGDNLTVLKILQESYLGKVKMIYIDPPYNTGNDFIYADDFKMEEAAYNEELGVRNEEGNRLFKNTDSNGRFHSDWCNMIYSRLLLARNLLTDNGVIFISIDNNEIDNILKICDEIFGRDNRIETIVWKNKYGAGAFTVGFISAHEYILCYSKHPVNNITCTFEGEEREKYNKRDEKYDIRGPYRTQPLMTNSLGDRPNLMYSIYYNGTEIKPKKQWVWSKERMDAAIANNDVEFILQKDGGYSVRSKSYLVDENGKIRRGKPLSVMNGPFTQDGTGEMRELFEGKTVFDFTKPSKLIKYLLSLEINDDSSKDYIVLDFFSGSATTAHAVMQLNAEDGGHRKFIMVQLPEECAKDSEAYKAGYKNICEIGKERIRRAGDKIKEEAGLTAQGLDIGFRVFHVDSSNMKDVYYHPEEISQMMLGETVSNIKEGRTDLDLLYSCLLDWGVEINLPHTSTQVAGCTMHNVDNGALMACFEENVPTAVVEKMAKQKPIKAVFRDSSFATDADKINVTEIFKNLSPDTKVKVI